MVKIVQSSRTKQIKFNLVRIVQSSWTKQLSLIWYGLFSPAELNN